MQIAQTYSPVPKLKKQLLYFYFKESKYVIWYVNNPQINGKQHVAYQSLDTTKQLSNSCEQQMTGCLSSHFRRCKFWKQNLPQTSQEEVD
jgi:hypothetical protein